MGVISPRITVQRLMLAVLVVGAVIGAVIEIDRARTRSADYLQLAYRAERVERGSRRRAENCVSQAAAIRDWVASGARGIPPGGHGDPDADAYPPKRAYTLSPSEAKAWQSDSDQALAMASKLEREAPELFNRASRLERRRKVFERRASYPYVFFASDAPSPENDAKEAGYVGAE